MTSVLFYNIIVVMFAYLNGEVYLDRPKIQTTDGDLIVKAAYNKNIFLRPNGLKSSIMVGEVDILNSNTKHDTVQTADESFNLQELLYGPQGILQTLEKFESRNSLKANDLVANNTMLWSKVNNLERDVNRLHAQINDLGKDKCQSNPCQHGGICLSVVNGYQCLCPTNWEGTDCDMDVNECRNFAGTDLGCQNGATCVNKPGYYECLCRSGWFGIHCTRKAKDGLGGDYEMCGHGTCLTFDTGEGITCICSQGWTTNGTGVTCLTDVNECDSRQGAHCSANPKVECVNLPGSFQCGQCPPGYEGDGYSCADIDECITIPNGGCSPMVACYNTIGSKICGPCPPGYEGDGIYCFWRGTCNMNHGGCHLSARCVENLSLGRSVQCVCPDDMDGDGIGPHGCYISTGNNSTENCVNNPCGIQGKCHLVRSGYTCICQQGYGGSHCDVPYNFCSGKPCHNGGICKQDNSTSAGFRCECTAQYSGPLCQVLSKACGDVIDAEEGSIIYPISNTTYGHNSTCAWIIHTKTSKVINVTFSKFDLEESPDCSFDFLQIHDGGNSASQLVNRFCGNSFPNGGNIISSQNNLYLWFRSDGTVAKDGFALHWTSIDPFCGGEIEATIHGLISSPGSPGKYPPNRDCYWHLTTNYRKRLQFIFYALDIESHSSCSFDYLSFYDGMQQTDPLINIFCNTSLPAPLISSGSEVLIHFHSDARGSGNGFQLAYVPVPGVLGCGGYFTDDRGELTVPTKDGTYLNNLLCEYKIRTRTETKVRIDFKQFSIQSSDRCVFDYLKVYDGLSEEFPLVGTFCGSTHPKFYVASSNFIFIRFRSDFIYEAEGFKIYYEAICQTLFNGDSGIIKSPGYPFSYPVNNVCVYVIRTTPGKVIKLTFQDFNVKDNRNFSINVTIGKIISRCQNDYVEIRDGINVNSTLLGKYCGSGSTPPAQLSTYNYMYIKFNSDTVISGTGFYANYTTITTNCGGIYRNTTGLINHPSGDILSVDTSSCTWILIAPVDMHIMLTWHRLYIPGSRACTFSYLELIDIDDNNGVNNKIGKFCGTKTPALTTFSNHLMMNFKSKISASLGFSVSYTFLDQNAHCGGNFYRNQGVIYSPGWPEEYETHQDCTWVITVPVGQHIRLNISHFDLEVLMLDACELADFLEIRNGATPNSPLIGQYCGKFKSKFITSLGNSLHIRFHSDGSLVGTGFMLEWDGSVFGCGGTLTSSTGSISSPNYPNSYNEYNECFYKIITSPGSRIRISLTDIDLNRNVICSFDYVEIFDGRGSDSSSLGRYCNMLSTVHNIETTSNYAALRYQSVRMMSGKGFLLNYITICNSNLSGTYGVIDSPDYPNDSLDCLWNIAVPLGNRINVTFTQYAVSNIYDLVDDYPFAESSYPFYNSLSSGFWNHYKQFHNRNCFNDYLQWKEVTETEYRGKYCERTAPPMITTKRNSLQIKFLKSVYGSNIRFRLEWVSYGCGGHLQRRSGSVSVDRSMRSSEVSECEWLIETPAGTRVSLVISEMFLTETQNCTVDSVQIYNGQDINSPLISTVCHRQTYSVQSTVNFMLIKFIKHSLLKGAYFTSNFNAISSICGGNIESHSGYIYSKNYPKNYDNNLDCIWIITVPRDHRIELNFMDFDLYYNRYSVRNKCGDSIKVFDSQYLTADTNASVICPDSTIRQIITKYNKIKIQFTSDNYGSAKGFKANFSVTCGAFITATDDGVISNRHYIGGVNKNCTWTICAAQLDQKISLTLTHIFLPKLNEISSNRSCSSSYLRVYDGEDTNAHIIGEYCGKKVPPMIVSRGSAITVLLGSYSNYSEGNFEAHYSSLNEACGGILSSEEGIIASPNYPRSYPMGSNCEWTLNTSPGNKVYITFEQFDVEYSERCNEDYLEIREDNGAGKLLAVYCGNDTPINTTIASQLYLKFHSGDRSSGRGFVLHYGFLHGNELINMEKGDIASPLYPHLYQGTATYSWRVLSKGPESISIIVNNLEIPSFGNVCNNYLSIYDGYDESAPLLTKLCGKLFSDEVIKTSSNMAYIKLLLGESNSGSLFHLSWAKNNVDVLLSNGQGQINCGSNYTEFIPAGNFSMFASPHFPENYDNELTCEWTFQTTSGQHLKLSFLEFEVEESNQCLGDYLNIYSSEILEQWKPVKEYICESKVAMEETNTNKHLKVTFNSDYSGNKKGFQGKVVSVCGGSITELSGKIGLTWDDKNNFNKCEWTVKVRAGRSIDLHFTHFNISNKDENHCLKWVTIRNGDTAEAPFLGIEKYCGYPHEIREQLTTSSNSLYISYNEEIGHVVDFQSFEIRYEEKNIECGVTSKLDFEQTWEVIHTPNYPSAPLPFSECIWVFTGPPGEILRIDFIDKFDLGSSNDCGSEFIDIRDGLSNLSPSIGLYCRENPGTIKTKDNVVFIRYLSQLSDPGNGFKANISIDVCGGTILADNGEIKSPGYPHMNFMRNNSVCEWRIKGKQTFVFKIIPLDISLPSMSTPCASNVTIEENVPFAKTTILRTFCAGLVNTKSIETSTNEFIIKFHTQTQNGLNLFLIRGFRFSFNSFRSTCGGTVRTSEGYITTPGYPQETFLRHCIWFIKVPNKTRRVRLEIIDSDINKQSIGVYNNYNLYNLIQGVPSVGNSPTVYEASGNKLALVLVNYKLTASRHKLKAKFTSDEEMLCGGNLNGISGKLLSPNFERPYTCEWHYDSKETNDDSVYNTILITVSVNSSFFGSTPNRLCRFLNSKINIMATLTSQDFKFYQDICGISEATFRIPASAIDITATQTNDQKLNFHLGWKSQPCGGIVNVGETLVNILQIPNDVNDTLDCAWLVMVPYNTRIELKIEGSFQHTCEDEFIKIGRGASQTEHLITNYCKDKTQHDPFVFSFIFINVQYHTKLANSSSVRLMAKTIKHPCGGTFSYETIFSSPNFPESYDPNEECPWLITTDPGMRISLAFKNRFAIEDTHNCTKDAVIIYDWKEETYNEIARLCGREIPAPINSTFNKMKVVLRTDATINMDGFQASWTSLCGGNYSATDNKQILFSPLFPNGYPPMSECTYIITAPENKNLIVQFLEFELEGIYPNCIYDNVSISGEDGSYHNYLFETYCGSKLPNIINDYKKITIVFKSDLYIQKKGFMLSFQVYDCGGPVNEPSVLSSHHGDFYNTNMNCTWLISAPNDKVILLKFQFIDLESHYECNNDFIAVYDDLLINDDKRLALLCGHVNSTTVLKSHGNKALLQFVSNEVYTFKGFKVDVLFTYSESVGCGGYIDLTTSSTKTFKSPLFGDNVVYENYLECHWTITSPQGTVVKIEFTSFQISPCFNVNQTATSFSKCDCDLVEIRDGLNLNSMVIGTYCGNTLPPSLHSSANQMSVRLSTDGELNGSGFEARITVQQSLCGQSQFEIGDKAIRLKSPGYERGIIPRGINCIYYVHQNLNINSVTRLTILDLDLQPAYNQSGTNKCNRDKLIITNNPIIQNNSIGKDYIMNHVTDAFIYTGNYYYEMEFNLPRRMEYCGSTTPSDLYVTGSVTISVATSPESDSKTYKGFEIDVNSVEFCGRNYTGTQGKIQWILTTMYYGPDDAKLKAHHECYTLITAPDNHTISAYFISAIPAYWNDQVYIDIFDGADTSSSKLVTIDKAYVQPLPVFTTSRYMLIHNHVEGNDYVIFDLNFVTTDKGRGCGGKLSNELGRVTSPMYPDVYRRRSSCEWELETPVGTSLKLHFAVFDLGRSCDQNYLQLVDSKGVVISSYCSEKPADYTSTDNYIKIIFYTTMNNGGTGWVADFVGIV